MALIDNFESYNLGDIGGQRTWAGIYGSFVVENSVKSSGTKALQFPSGDASAINNLFASNNEANGAQIFYIRSSATTKRGKIIFRNKENDKQITQIGFGSGDEGGEGNLFTTYSGGQDNLIVGYSADTFYKLTLEWKDDHTHRVKVDSGEFTSYRADDSADSAGFGGIQIYSDGAHEFYVDDFSGAAPTAFTATGAENASLTESTTAVRGCYVTCWENQ